MRESEFNRRLRDEFGEAYAGLVGSSHNLHELGNRTAEQAIADGVPPARVWDAICEAFDIPPERRLGQDLPIIEHPFE